MPTNRERAEAVASIIFSHLLDNEWLDDTACDDEEEIKEYIADVVFSDLNQVAAESRQ